MEVKWAMWAKDAVVEKDGSLIIWRAYDTAGWDEFPVIAKLFVVISCDVSASEYGQVKIIGYRLIDYDGNIILDYDEEWTVPEKLGAMRFGWSFFTDIEEVELPRPGYYQLEILIGGEPKVEVPLNVIKIEEENYDEEDEESADN